jgi:peroxiredoxin Q/BCP
MSLLRAGEPAPGFEAPDQHGNVVRFGDLRGKPVVLYFYPADDTPGCTREGIGFTQQKAEFAKANTEIVGVSTDSGESHKKFCEKYDLTVTLAADPTKATTRAFGVLKESGSAMRTTFLVDKSGKIAKVWENVKVDGHVEDVLASVRLLK